MTIHSMMTPPVMSPWVSTSPMREPSGVVYQDTSLRLWLSVDLSIASGGAMFLSASSRAVLSSNWQIAMLIPSIVPPLLYAFSQTGERAASQALSAALMAACCAADAVAKLACCTASMAASAVSALPL